MKRTIFFRLFSVILLCAYATMIILGLSAEFVEVNRYWFSAIFMVLGLIFLCRYFCYHIDSSLFIGQLLFLSGVFGIVNFYFHFGLLYSFVGYISSISVASLSVFVKFRQLFHLKTFVFLGLCAILITVYAEGLMSFWPFILLFSGTVVTVAVLAINSITANTRKI